jgi:hypothetical protein
MDFINLPEQQSVTDQIAEHYKEILRLLGEDVEREGLIKTPHRVAKAMQFITQGYYQKPEEILRSATINAKRKAEILCDASGAKLGDLIAIDYNWGELDIYSHTRFDCCEEALAPMKACSIDIDPDDIDVSDTATFVWELV